MTKPLHNELQIKPVQFTANSDRKDKLLTTVDRLHIQLPSSVSEALSSSECVQKTQTLQYQKGALVLVVAAFVLDSNKSISNNRMLKKCMYNDKLILNEYTSHYHK